VLLYWQSTATKHDALKAAHTKSCCSAAEGLEGARAVDVLLTACRTLRWRLLLLLLLWPVLLILLLLVVLLLLLWLCSQSQCRKLARARLATGMQ
jgi:hypothetical protein